MAARSPTNEIRRETRSTAARRLGGLCAGAVILSIGALSGCDFTRGHTVIEYSVDLVVYGMVTDDQSRPVVGAVVYTKAHRNNDCEDLSGLTGHGNTNAAGNYRIRMGSWGRTYTACVEARLDHFEESLNVPGQRPNVVLKENSPLDSVRIDLVRVAPPAP